ncbi:MAG: hypothetical protein IJM41_06960 [Bacteroidales bacterium]|nr:hypothetical protein [Bacteroidales bacterium]MBQ9888965.1 hypothetical protein [Bacteroidales bacterium]
MKDDYSDIIGLPHHESSVHPRMPLAQRAAQFAPFAALSGYDEAIVERARLTDQKEDDESLAGSLDRTVQMLRSQLSQRPSVKVSYFRPDGRKSGGKYVSVSGRLKDIDDIRREFILEQSSGEEILRVPVADISGIEII